MAIDKLKQLEAAKARLAQLQAAVTAQLRKELATLPGKYGFDDVAGFVRAVREAADGRRGRRAATKVKAPKGRRRRRAVITDAIRAEVKKLAEQGKTGAAIAKATGISLPSVQNIKKAAGLVKARK